MKHVVPVVLLVFASLFATAQNSSSVGDKSGVSRPVTKGQKNNFFGDLGLSGGIVPGASFTYNWKKLKRLGIGGGIQAYDYLHMFNRNRSSIYFVPAVYIDFRAYVPVKRSLFFFFTDLGINIYGKVMTNNALEDPHTNGFYSGFGIGYCHRMTPRGIGPYISLKMAGNSYVARQHSLAAGRTSEVFNLDATPVLSLGVKF